MNTIALYRLLAIAGLSLLTACTPSHTRDTARQIGEGARLLDGVEVVRGHNRMIARQARICLVADDSLRRPDVLLQLAQQAFAAEFAAVGVEPQTLSYLEMIQVRPCQSADYLFHIAAQCVTECRADPLLVRIAHPDGSRFDNVQLHLQGGWWRFGSTSAAQRQAAFTRLARQLAGS